MSNAKSDAAWLRETGKEKRKSDNNDKLTKARETKKLKTQVENIVCFLNFL